MLSDAADRKYRQKGEIKSAVYCSGVYWNSGSIIAIGPMQPLTLRANKIYCDIIVTMNNDIASIISAISIIRRADRARRINLLVWGFSTIYVVVPVAVLRF
jgi:hypothetical protein